MTGKLIKFAHYKHNFLKGNFSFFAKKMTNLVEEKINPLIWVYGN